MTEWVEWVLSREFRQFVLDNNLFFPLLFLARLIGVTALELVVPARKISYRSVIPHDLIVCSLYFYLLVPAAEFLSDHVAIRAYVPASVMELPIGARVLIYFVVGDFGAYWMHRLMHVQALWRVHKWHHSPTTMYWLAGFRASLPQQTLFNLPWIFAFPVFDQSSWWIGLAVATSHMLLNDWMHMNVSWRSNWLEWILITPRYHHIHHSDKPAHYMANFGVTFTTWDRLFGTYVNPDDVKEPLSFGIGEEVPAVRLVLGA